jgi:hypothetical protein
MALVTSDSLTKSLAMHGRELLTLVRCPYRGQKSDAPDIARLECILGLRRIAPIPVDQNSGRLVNLPICRWRFMR